MAARTMLEPGDNKMAGPPAERHDDTHARPGDPFADLPVIERRAPARPASWSEEEATFEAVVMTESPVRRRDAKGDYLEVLPADAFRFPIRGSDLPLLDTHRGGSSRAVIGRAFNFRREGDAIVATLRLSLADDVAGIRQRVADGTLRHVSLGYRVPQFTEAARPDGTREKRAREVVPVEVSLVDVPADPAARVRSATPPGDDPMPEDQPHTDERPGDDLATRRAEIRSIVRAAGGKPEEADDLIDNEATADEARAAMFERMATRRPARVRTATASPDDPAVIRERRATALQWRAGLIDDLPEEARPYAHDTLMDHARASLEAGGVSTRTLSPDEVIHRAGQHTTSDFPVITQNVANLAVMQSYEREMSPLMRLSRRRTVSDFKPQTAVRLGEMSDLSVVGESGEITSRSLLETGESISVRTYAARLDLSRQLIINDSLSLFADAAAEMGRAASSTQANVLVEELLAATSKTLADGTEVVASSRGNLAGVGADLGTAGDAAAFDAARKHFRKMTGLDGSTLISATPRFLLISPDAEAGAEQIMASIFPSTQSEVNIWTDAFDVLVEPRLSGQPWWLFADPARLPSLHHAFLNGATGPTVQRQESWDVLGTSFRVYMDFGAAWMDWRGVYLNEGA